MNKRPSWKKYFFEVMDAISKRATCDRGRSGCVIVKDNNIISSGYVGSPPGLPHCDDVGHLMELHSITYVDNPGSKPYKTFISSEESSSQHCVRTVHAEMNAILQAAKRGVALEGAELYCRMTPCRTCAMAIISVGIKKVFCERKYQKAEESEKLFETVGIPLEYVKEEVQEYE